MIIWFSFFPPLSAFHILKDTTIQLTLEKIPTDKDTQFTFLPCDESYTSSGVLKVEGKFVNAVQVRSFIIFNCCIILYNVHCAVV